ncbi:hypothetical protein [Haloarcula laminariae]|uniref:hypothetical protein n=1 Tax=Haloarcula laminariae TaxID=2961577 RepID=UPI0021C5CBF3
MTGAAGLTEMHGIGLSLIGVAIVGGAVGFERRNRVRPTVALAAVFIGLVLATAGAVLFDGLSADPQYVAASIPFSRSLYPLIAFITGITIMIGSLAAGLFRWPTRPRYTGLGFLLGLWVIYPYLIPGPASNSHPLGYVLVLSLPIAVGYILKKDAAHVIRDVLRDSVARRFGLGVGLVAGLFFLFITGYLSVFPEEGLPHQSTTVVLPIIYQLVSWPTLEIVRPHIPFFLALSPGLVIIVGLLSSLIGLNAAIIARYWRIEEHAGLTEGTTGTATVVGSCTCGCCGPLVAKIGLLALGPSVAAPLYWVFVDPASPLTVLFIVGTIALFTGSLINSIESAVGSDRAEEFLQSD